MIHAKTMLGFLGMAVLATGCVCGRHSSETAAAPTDAAKVRPLLIGATVPETSLKKPSGDVVRLNTVLASKPTVLIFYRGGWCPFCTRQLAGLSAIYPELKTLGYQLIAISADRPMKLKDAAKEHKLDYLLLSDNDMQASKAFGIAFKLPDDLVSLYKTKYGIDVEADSGRTHHMLPVPSVFLISPNSTVSFAYVNPDYKTRLNPEVILAVAKSTMKSKK